MLKTWNDKSALEFVRSFLVSYWRAHLQYRIGSGGKRAINWASHWRYEFCKFILDLFAYSYKWALHILLNKIKCGPGVHIKLNDGLILEQNNLFISIRLQRTGITVQIEFMSYFSARRFKTEWHQSFPFLLVQCYFSFNLSFDFVP